MDDVGWLQKISRSGHLDQTERFEQLLDLVWYVMDSSVLHYESVYGFCMHINPQHFSCSHGAHLLPDNLLYLLVPGSVEFGLCVNLRDLGTNHGGA